MKPSAWPPVTGLCAALAILAGLRWHAGRGEAGELRRELDAARRTTATRSAAALRVDTVYRAAARAAGRLAARYQTARRTVPVFDTSRVVLVDTAVVVLADSMRATCDALATACAARAAASDSLASALRAENAALRKLERARHPTPPRRWRVAPGLFAGLGPGGWQLGLGLTLRYGR